MERLSRLPLMALTDLQPCFYDIESVSTVEMVAKLYKYIQNMVDDYNIFIKEINSEIDAFEQETNKNLECFESCIKKLMLDYIESIDTKIDEQDAKIENSINTQNNTINDAVNYMKNNLLVSINNLFAEAVANGDIKCGLTEEYNEPNESLRFYITEVE